MAAIAAALADGDGLHGDEFEGDSDAAAARRDDLARRATAWSASAVLMPVAGELSPEHSALEHEVLVSPISEDAR